MSLRELTIDELLLVSGGDDGGGGIDTAGGGTTPANYYGAFDNGFPDAYVNAPAFDAAIIADGMSESNGLSEGSSFGNDFGDANSGPGGADSNSNVA